MKQDEAYYNGLWQQFRFGEQSALAEIYRDYIGVLFNYGYNICPDAAMVQDAIQDLFVELWRLRETLGEAQSVKFYLFRSLRRRLHQAQNKDKKINAAENDSFLFETHYIESQPFEEEEYQRKIQQLHQLIETLPPRQIEALRLRYFDNFSLEQVAQIMNMNEQSVRNSINRAIAKLRHSLVHWLWWALPVGFSFL
jgi:RNA polymerase sigma factor (sigma-70 family)